MLKKIWKQLFMMFICVLFTTACSSNLDRDKYNHDSNISEEIKQVEMFNIASDLKVFEEAYHALNNELNKLSKEETNKEAIIAKASLAQINYMNKVYELSVTRVHADIQGIYNDSEEYISYIALLQTYADAFNEDKEQLLNEVDVTNDSFKNCASSTALSLLEGYYLNILASIDE